LQIVALFALAAMVVIEPIYLTAISLARGAPVIAIGALFGWLTQRHGAQSARFADICALAAVQQSA
jgi:hypothetical protein